MPSLATASTPFMANLVKARLLAFTRINGNNPASANIPALALSAMAFESCMFTPKNPSTRKAWTGDWFNMVLRLLDQASGDCLALRIYQSVDCEEKRHCGSLLWSPRLAFIPLYIFIDNQSVILTNGRCKLNYAF